VLSTAVGLAWSASARRTYGSCREPSGTVLSPAVELAWSASARRTYPPLLLRGPACDSGGL